jgi:DNA-binding XRE family transcriptional regulator
MTRDTFLNMSGDQFRKWRESFGLTQSQMGEKLKVTRTTIQNWEASLTLPTFAEMSAEVWDGRLKQESPDLGPVTLVYSDGPMFVDPYGPRHRPAMMQQEAYPSNAMALARVQELWGRSDFFNPLIIAEDQSPLWNSVDLAGVMAGRDPDAPILINLIRMMAKSIRANSAIFIRNSPKMLTPSETSARQKSIEAQSDILDKIADSGLEAAISAKPQIEAVLRNLQALGTRAPDTLVSGICQALVVFEKSRQPRSEGPNEVLDYKGYRISWLRIPQTSGPVAIAIGAEISSLFAKLDRHQSLIMAPDTKTGVQQAKDYIDSIAV